MVSSQSTLKTSKLLHSGQKLNYFYETIHDSLMWKNKVDKALGSAMLYLQIFKYFISKEMDTLKMRLKSK